MRFFSKFTFICNICFLVTAFFNYSKMYLGDSRVPQPLNILKGTVVILGEFSWILNFVFVLLWLILLLASKKPNVTKWIGIANVLILFFQVYYFFIDRS